MVCACASKAVVAWSLIPRQRFCCLGMRTNKRLPTLGNVITVGRQMEASHASPHCACVTRYTHVHHVPHAEHVESSIGQNGDAQSTVETMPCCPLPIPFMGQRAK